VRIVVVHNHYQSPGGEDLVAEQETSVLRWNEHTVQGFIDDNGRIPEIGRAKVAAETVWNPSAYHCLHGLVRSTAADIVHFHNTFPLLSPSCYYAARRAGAAVVQTLHNYRLLCPSANMYRDGGACEDCAGRFFAWPGVAHACYRQSRAATLATATMLATHRAIGTWWHAVDAYISLTDFARDKFVAHGIRAEKVHVKPNFLSKDPGAGSGAGDYGLFVGRLAEEKGILTLLDAWERLPSTAMLHVVGDGPLAKKVSVRVRRLPNVHWTPHLGHDAVCREMKDARFLVVPSTWYEGFPLVVVEAFACGTPVIASDIGSLKCIVKEHLSGLRVRPNDAEHLASAIQHCYSHPEELAAFRHAARAEYEAKYTAERNYRVLMDIYDKALCSARKRVRPPSKQRCAILG